MLNCAALRLPVYLFLWENISFKTYFVTKLTSTYTVYTLTINCLARKPLSDCDCVCSGTSGPRSMPMIVAPVTTTTICEIMQRSTQQLSPGNNRNIFPRNNVDYLFKGYCEREPHSPSRTYLIYKSYKHSLDI